MAKKIKQTIVVDGFEKEIEVEVPDSPPATWGDLSKLRILGKRNPRLEGPDKVTGKAKYASDIVLPGLCYGRFVPCPHAAARITAIDLSSAEKMTGVKAVMPLAKVGDLISWAGSPVAALAAVTPELADDAIRSVKVTYQVLPFVVDEEKAKAANAPEVKEGTKTNLVARTRRTTGDVDGAFRQADVVHEGTYEAQTRLHCCLETHGHTAKWDGNRLTIWASTQNVEGVRGEAGRLAGGNQNARVICEHMGGGFGSKFNLLIEGTSAVQLAKMANAPVKFMLTRWDEQTRNFRGPGAKARIRIAAKRDGTMLGADIELENYEGIESNAEIRLSGGPYVVSAQSHRVVSNMVLTHTAGQAALRAPGSPQAEVIWAAALDDLAAKLNMDPLELRKKNHSDPVRVAEWDIGARIIGWDRRQKVPGSATGVRKRGMGMGTGTWGGGGRGDCDCTILVGKDGSVRAQTCVQDLGTGIRNYVAGIIAEELGLTLKDVTAEVGASEYGKGHGSGGSTTTGSLAPAVKMGAMETKERLILAASQALKVKPEEVELQVGGRFTVKSDASKALTWKQVCATLPAGGLKILGNWNESLQAGGAAGCTFAEVEVDTETGKVTVLKVVGVQDCGVVLNRLQAESQVMGGIIQGIGTALLEERHMDNVTGRMLNPNLEEYKLCGAFEAGGINVNMDPPYRTLRPDERAVVAVIYDVPTGKVIGIGEPAVIPVQAAIMNAVFNATGARVAPPATPDRVMAALAAKKGATA